MHRVKKCLLKSYSFLDQLKILSALSLVTLGVSMEINPLRDFSKLRLEDGSSGAGNSGSASTTLTRSFIPGSLDGSGGSNSGYSYNPNKEPAVVSEYMDDTPFKPSYQDNVDFPDYHKNFLDVNNNPLNEEGNKKELYDSNSHGRIQSSSSRPFLSSNMNRNQDDDFSHPPGSHGNEKNGERPDRQSQSQPDEYFFLPAPPSESFTEIEHDPETGTLKEKGMGGLYDGDDEAGENLEEEQGEHGKEQEGQRGHDDSEDYYNEPGIGGLNGQGEDNHEYNTGGSGDDDGRRGYGGFGRNHRFNTYGSVNNDYGDY